MQDGWRTLRGEVVQALDDVLPAEPVAVAASRRDTEDHEGAEYWDAALDRAVAGQDATASQAFIDRVGFEEVALSNLQPCTRSARSINARLRL